MLFEDLPGPRENPPSTPVPHVDRAEGGFSFEYDDGNGLWISVRETPSDQDFSGKYHPQDYAVGERAAPASAGERPPALRATSVRIPRTRRERREEAQSLRDRRTYRRWLKGS